MPTVFRPRLTTLALGFLATAMTAAPARADQIDRVLAENAGKIVDEVVMLQAKNVAVLKFQVKFADGSASYRAGSMGADMVRRTENLLALMLDSQKPQFVVLTGAGEEAAKLAKASKTAIDWTTPEGRKKLFGMKLPVLWNDKDVREPDAFVTGVVTVAKDFRSVTIELKSFTKANPEKLRKSEIEVKDPKPGVKDKNSNWVPLLPPVYMDRAMLASLGQSFATSRGLKTFGKSRDWRDDDADAAQATVQNLGQGGAGGGVPTGLVEFKILLGGKEQTIQPDDGTHGPRVSGVITTKGATGQKMTFNLKNTHSEPLAVLLCVNGANVIAENNETLDDPTMPRNQFRMFVLEPQRDYSIPGLLVRAAANEKSQWKDLVVYPEDVASQIYTQMNPETRGKIQLMVFGPPVQKLNITPGKPAQNPLLDDPQVQFDTGFLSNGLATRARKLGSVGNLADARAKLISQTKLVAKTGKLGIITADPRDLVGPGQNPPNERDPVRVVEFKRDEQPRDSIVIGYYTQ